MTVDEAKQMISIVRQGACREAGQALKDLQNDGNFAVWSLHLQQELYELLYTATCPVVKWQLPQILMKYHWPADRYAQFWDRFSAWLSDSGESRIVRVNSLQALWEIVEKYPEFKSELKNIAALIKREEIPSLLARLRILKL